MMTWSPIDISINPKKASPETKPKIARRFEDGSVEAEFPSGYRVRKAPFNCSVCGLECVEHSMSGLSAALQRASLCEQCFNAERSERAAALSAERQARLLLGETPAQRRYVALVLATPDWRDRREIQKIYDLAAKMTKDTGVLHEVDHIYPIQSKFGCGLHVHQNLQILSKYENRSKKNKFPMHDSPALV